MRILVTHFKGFKILKISCMMRWSFTSFDFKYVSLNWLLYYNVSYLPTHLNSQSSFLVGWNCFDRHKLFRGDLNLGTLKIKKPKVPGGS